MEDVMLSAAAARIIALVEEQASHHVNLVRGAEKEVRGLAEKLNSIRNVLDDAENRRFKDKNINYWLSRLELTSREMEDVLDEWNYAILKHKMEKVWSFIPSSSCLCLNKVVVRHDIAGKIVNVKAQVDEILKEKDQFNFVMSRPTDHPSLPKSWRDQSTSFTDLAEVHGRDSDRDILVSKLMGKTEELDCIQVVSIVGVGGLGKTTLAQLAYNDSRVEKHFDLRIWVCVSDPFDLVAIAKGIIESVKKGDSPSTNNLETLLESVRDCISGKIFLLVLDDVWTEEYGKWEHLENNLKCGGEGSKILVTTRKTKVAKITGTMDKDIHYPGGLSVEDCWIILRRIALFGRDKVGFEETGKEISKKCNGLPLAAKALGSVLRCKTSLGEWKGVLNSEIWEMKEAEVELFPHLLMSYNELSPTLKRCFSYCAVFSKDSDIYVHNLIENWMALGYLGSNSSDMEDRGQEYFDILAMHSLFQDFEKDDLDGKITKCKMHDIVHDFAQFLKKSGRVEATGMNKSTTCRACEGSQVPTVNEFCCLIWDFNESPPNICDCLTHLRVLSLKECRRISQRMGNLIHLRWLNLYRNKPSRKDLKIIFQLYNLQYLCLMDCKLKEIPKEIGNLIHLRNLNLSWNKSLEELPREIGNLSQLKLLNLSWNNLKELPKEIENLIHLRHLDVSQNESLKVLPREIVYLIHLRHINLSWNESLNELPDNICGLQELQSLQVFGCKSLCKLPEGLTQLTGLRTLTGFEGGSGLNKLGLLKNLNHLSGSLDFTIKLTDDLEEAVEDARSAELRNKMHIQRLVIRFEDEMEENEESSRMRMDVIDALQPHPSLRELDIWYYKGSKLPMGWMVSPLNQLRKVSLYYWDNLTSLPPFGKLPCLEKIKIRAMYGMKIIRREFLGLKRGGDVLDFHESSSNTDVLAFPKLKNLTFNYCGNWTEWEDITAEEEESASLSLMPCLTKLKIRRCSGLTVLPHRLLRKASSLEKLDISGSTELQQRYENKDGSDWKSKFRNNLRLQRQQSYWLTFIAAAQLVSLSLILSLR